MDLQMVSGETATVGSELSAKDSCRVAITKGRRMKSIENVLGEKSLDAIVV